MVPAVCEAAARSKVPAACVCGGAGEEPADPRKVPCDLAYRDPTKERERHIRPTMNTAGISPGIRYHS